MARGSLGVVANGFARLFGEGSVSGLSERQLLDRFLADGDAAAFEALVSRHGPMVLSVCRRVLRDDHAAEDAFQATFLLLVRKARSIRATDLLGPWLHRVAYRVAVRAGKGDAKRRAKETSSPEVIAQAPSAEIPDRELGFALHEALDMLPEKYRAPVVLCYLEGRSHDEAARRLKWPIGSVKGRLSRARTMLKGRLERRGVLVPAGLILAGLGGKTMAAVPSHLSETTIEAAKRFAVGRSAGVAAGTSSTAATALAEEAARAMLMKKLMVFAASFAALGLCVGGAAVLARQDGVKPQGDTAKTTVTPDRKVGPATPKTDLDRLQGRWERLRVESGGQTLGDGFSPAIFQEIAIRGDVLLRMLNDGSFGSPRTLKVDESRHHLEWQRTGEAGEEVTRAIYRIDDKDSFSIWYDRGNPKQRPDSYDVSHPDGRLKISFKRSESDPQPTPETQAELEKLQGTWQYIGGEVDGEPLTKKQLNQMGSGGIGLKIEGDVQQEFSSGPNSRSMESRIAVDVSKTPHILETRYPVVTNGNPKAESNSKKVLRSLYKLDADRLTVCSNLNDWAIPPNELVTRPGDGRRLSIYQKMLNPTPVKAVAAPTSADIIKRLEGMWETVLFVQDGKAVNPDKASAVANPTYISAGRWVSLGTPLSADSTISVDNQNPQILVLTDGDAAKTTRRMLFKLEDDTLTFCISKKNQQNVADLGFETKPNDGRFIQVMKRLDAKQLADAMLKQNQATATIATSIEPKKPAQPAAAKEVANTTFKTDSESGASRAHELQQEANRLSSNLSQITSTIEDEQDQLEAMRQQIRDFEKKSFDLQIANMTRDPLSELQETRERRLKRDDDALRVFRSTSQELRTKSNQLRKNIEENRQEARKAEQAIETLRAKADEAAKRPGKPNTVQVGDLLIVELLEALPGRPLTGERVVRPDGTISLGFYGDLKVVGLTRKEIKVKLIEKMRKYINDENLGLVAEDEKTGKQIAVDPADSDRVNVDDSPTYAPTVHESSRSVPQTPSVRELKKN